MQKKGMIWSEGAVKDFSKTYPLQTHFSGGPFLCIDARFFLGRQRPGHKKLKLGYFLKER